MRIRPYVGVLTVLMFSCGINKQHCSVGENVRIYKPDKKEESIYTARALMEAYTMTYAEIPRNATDVITFIEKSDSSSHLLYKNQYDFFKKHQGELIFDTDENLYTTIYVKDKKQKNIYISFAYKNPCEDSHLERINLIDRQGYIVTSESLNRLISQSLHDIYIRYKDSLQGWHASQRITIEYKSGQLKNLCNRENIDINKSEYFSTIYHLLHTLANENDLSRVILSVFIDKSISLDNQGIK